MIGTKVEVIFIIHHFYILFPGLVALHLEIGVVIGNRADHEIALLPTRGHSQGTPSSIYLSSWSPSSIPRSHGRNHGRQCGQLLGRSPSLIASTRGHSMGSPSTASLSHRSLVSLGVQLEVVAVVVVHKGSNRWMEVFLQLPLQGT